MSLIQRYSNPKLIEIMDFSHYGNPSSEWLEFVSRNPQASRDGYDNNDLKLASELRESANKIREATSQKLLRDHCLLEKVDISTLSIASRGSHSIPLRRYVPSSDWHDGEGLKPRCLVYFHGGGFLFGSETSDDYLDRKSTRLNSSHSGESRMPSSA